jgi:hypothetical protein
VILSYYHQEGTLNSCNMLKTHEKHNTNVLKIVVVWAHHQTYEEQKGTDVCSFHIRYMCGTRGIVLFMPAPHISWLSWNAASSQSMSHSRNKWQPPVKTGKVAANGFSLELSWDNTLLGNGFSLDLTWHNTLWNVHRIQASGLWKNDMI